MKTPRPRTRIETVHVSFGDSIYFELIGLPKTARRGCISVCFRVELSAGDISDAPRSNSAVHAHCHGGYKLMEKLVEKNTEKLSAAPDSAAVYLWLNERDVNGYLNLLKFAYLFKRFDEVYLIRCCSKEDMENEEYRSTNSFEKRVRLTGEDLDAMTARFSEISAEVGVYRVGRFGEVRVCSEEFMESYVLKEVKKKYRGFGITEFT